MRTDWRFAKKRFVANARAQARLHEVVAPTLTSESYITMLGEASTTAIARRSDAVGFVENRQSAKQGGTIAGNTRAALEAKTGKAVVSQANYLTAPSAPGLVGDTAPAQPSKPKARVQVKPPKGNAARCLRRKQ